MPSNLLDGLPLGIIMFVGMVVAVVWRKIGRKRATADVPQLARELALEFVPSRHARGQGRLKGSYQSYEVRVDPEETRVISVNFKIPVEVDLRTYEQARRAPSGWVTVHSKDRAFNRFFKSRVASEALAKHLAESELPSKYLQPFERMYERQLESLTVTAEGVKCKLNFGNPAYIPAAAIRALLPACIALASFVESGQSPEERAAMTETR